MGLALAASKESSIREPALALLCFALLRLRQELLKFQGASAAPWSFGKCSTSDDVFIATFSQTCRRDTMWKGKTQPRHAVFAAKERCEERRRCRPIEHDRALRYVSSPVMLMPSCETVRVDFVDARGRCQRVKASLHLSLFLCPFPRWLPSPSFPLRMAAEHTPFRAHCL